MSISFELAEKLKNAGFPQLNHMIEWELSKKVLHRVGYHLTSDGIDERYPDGSLINKARLTSIYSPEFINSEEGIRSTVYIPTLEELIKECSIEINLNGYKDKWDCNYGYTGSTPEEAVANLYINLNQKSV